MTITIENAEKMDLVLMYLLENQNARVKSKQVQGILKSSFYEAKNIYESILNYHNQVEPVISILNADSIAARPNITENFVKKGGFKLVYKLQVEQAERFSDETKKQFIQPELNWQRKTYWIILSLAILGFIMGLISLFISLGLIKIKY